MPADLRGSLRGPWIPNALLGLVLTGAYFALPDLDDVLYLVVGISATLAILAGVRIYRPLRTGWVTLAAGVGLYVLGDLLYTVIAAMTQTEPFPSPADAAYIAGQVLVVVGIGRLASPIERGWYRPSVIDAALIATAGAFIAWPLILDPLTASQTELLGGAVAVSYPVIDVVLIGVLARHALSPGHKTPSLLLIMAGVAVWLFSDLAYVGLGLSGEYTSGMWLDAGWLVAYVAIGTAALHPSMARLVPFVEPHEVTISNGRLGVIGIVFTIPVLSFVLHGPLVHPGDFAANAFGSALLGGLGVGRLLGALGASRRILAEQRALEAELARRARTDRLTGLANRAALTDRLAAAQAEGAAVGLVYLDLDDFKRVNDAFGHPVGEDVLRETSTRLRRIVPDPDDVGHIGGDEFAMVVRPCPIEADAVRIANQVLEALNPDVQLGGHTFRISASVGIVWAAGGTLTADEIMSRADIAMYEAKERGGSTYVVFVPEMHQRAVARSRLQNDLDHAVARGELEPWFQPIYDVASGELVGMEALARWRHPAQGFVPPDTFIPIAELSGAIGEIDRHIIHTAAGLAAEWNELADRPLKLHVNITPREAADPATIGWIRSALDGSGLPASSLVIEVTETALIDEVAVAPVFAGLKALGTRLSIDDFGSRYAVLTQLGRLPVDIVKIDRGIVQGLSSLEGTRLFEGVIRLAQSLRLETVAEGVESIDVLPALRRLGCDAAQGFGLGRPMPAGELERLIVESVRRAAIA